MRTSSILATASLVIVLLGPAWAQRGPLPPPLIKEGLTEKISEHVYVIPDGEVLLVPNVGIIVGPRGALVVDHPEHDLGAAAFPASAKMLRSRGRTPSR